MAIVMKINKLNATLYNLRIIKILERCNMIEASMPPSKPKKQTEQEGSYSFLIINIYIYQMESLIINQY